MDSGKRLQELQRKRAGTLSVDQHFSNGDHKFVESDSCGRGALDGGAVCGRTLPVDYVRGFYFLQLVAEHDIRPRGGELVKNMKAVGQ